MSGGGQYGSSGEQGGQNAGGGQATTTTAARQQDPTLSAAFDTLTNPSSSTSWSAQKGAIIGGIVGGLCGLLVITLIAIWLVKRRRKQKVAQRKTSVETVSYAGLNASLAGVPFDNGSTPNHQQHNSLVPPPLFHANANASFASAGIPLRDGEASPYGKDSPSEGDQFLPSYVKSPSDVSRRMRHPLTPIDTSGRVHDSAYVSPLSTGTFTPPPSYGTPHRATLTTLTPVPTPGIRRQQTSDTMGFPQDDADMIPPGLPRMPTMPARNRDTVDTMGFPVDSRPENTTVVPIVHSMAPPNSFGRVASHLTNGGESPVLGYNQPVIRKPAPRTGNAPPPAHGNNGMWSGFGVSRNPSQRTVSSMSSFAPPMVSDEELERLGVGARHGHSGP